MAKQWTWAFLASVMQFDVERIIEVCDACGVKALEYNHRGVEGMREHEIEALRERYADAGIAVSSFHLPFHAADDIASFYESERRSAVARMNHWMRIAGLLGSRVVIQHPTTNRHPAAENGLDRYFEQLYKSLEAMLPVAKEADVVIGIENMTPGERRGRFCSEATHFRRLAREVTDPNVGFVYDTGHALMSEGSQALKILEAMGERVAAWHLADNAGDRDSHLAPGHGRVNWNGVFRFADQVGYVHPMTIETPPWGPGPEYSIDTWQECARELDALVEGALRRPVA